MSPGLSVRRIDPTPMVDDDCLACLGSIAIAGCSKTPDFLIQAEVIGSGPPCYLHIGYAQE